MSKKGRKTNKKAVLRQIVRTLAEQYPMFTEAAIARIAKCSEKKVYKILESETDGSFVLGEGEITRIQWINHPTKPPPIITFP